MPVLKFCPAWGGAFFPVSGTEEEEGTMKKLCTLLLAAGLVFGAATGASAIDFQA